MFSTLLQKIPEFFSLRFLFGSYLPLLILVVVSSLLGWLTFWPVQQWLENYLKLTEGLIQTLIATSAAVLIAVAAMICNGLITFVQRTLEGRGPAVPQILRNWLTKSRAKAFERLDGRYETAAKAKHTFGRLTKEYKSELNKAREQGGHATQCRYAANDEIATLRRNAILGVRSDDVASEPPSMAVIKVAYDRLASALRTHNANSQDPADAQCVRLLNQDQAWFEDLLDYFKRQHDMRVRAFHDEREAWFPFGEVSASRMGAVATSVEGYFETRYGMDYSILWPRLESVVRKEATETATALDSIGAQLDFYLTMLWTTLLTWILWTVILSCTGSTPWLLLVVGVGSPLLAAIWWRMAVITYINLARQVRVSVDFHRGAFVKQLGLKPPTSLDAEKKFWTKVTRFFGFGEPHDLPYADAP